MANETEQGVTITLYIIFDQRYKLIAPNERNAICAL